MSKSSMLHVTFKTVVDFANLPNVLPKLGEFKAGRIAYTVN